MAEHLHGYPQCETPAGQSCPPADLNYIECHSHGAMVSCTASVVDGIPTGQYQCVHRDKQAPPKRKAAAKAKKKAKSKPKKKAAAKPKRKAKKAGKKAAAKAKGKGKGKKKAGQKKKK